MWTTKNIFSCGDDLSWPWTRDNCSAAEENLIDKTNANQVQVLIKVKRKILCGKKKIIFSWARKILTRKVKKTFGIQTRKWECRRWWICWSAPRSSFYVVRLRKLLAKFSIAFRQSKDSWRNCFSKQSPRLSFARRASNSSLVNLIWKNSLSTELIRTNFQLLTTMALPPTPCFCFCWRFGGRKSGVTQLLVLTITWKTWSKVERHPETLHSKLGLNSWAAVVFGGLFSSFGGLSWQRHTKAKPSRIVRQTCK